MARLFVSPKDIDFMNDVVKELVKDVVGQKIYYYAISVMKSKVHEVYGESLSKIFEKPIMLDVIAGQPAWESKMDIFGKEQTATIEILVQARDLIDKHISPNEGDYFTYGDASYEIVSFVNLNNIYGQEEYDSAFKLIGKLARPGEFNPKDFFRPSKDVDGNLSNKGDFVQSEFEQQRGNPEDSQGNETGDIRHVRERMGDDVTPNVLGEKPAKIKPDPDKGLTTGFLYDD
jgi:hypothetical protein